jgi:hypothetical protein
MNLGIKFKSPKINAQTEVSSDMECR